MVWFKINPASGIPIYLQIGQQIKTAVASGALQPGDQLPSVRELALELTINPNTAAKAYQELEREGIITTIRGKGTFIANQETPLNSKANLELLNHNIDRLIIDTLNMRLDLQELKELIDKRLTDWQKNLNREGQT